MWRGTSSAGNSSVSHRPSLPPLSRKSSGHKKGKGQRLTLTSKHNWWLIDVEEGSEPSTTPRTPIERPPVDVSPPHFTPPPHPSSIFGHASSTSTSTSSSFPAPQNPTARLAPFATGSTSELFKCIIKKPDIVQLEINGEMQTNAPDVTAQILAELRVYSTISGHPNFPVYLGSLDGIGMVLEYIDGRSLLDVLTSARPRGGLDRRTKIDFHDQLLNGLSYLHSFGLSHGDLSLLNVLVTHTHTLKILDFGRSTSITSVFAPPSKSPPPWPEMPIFTAQSQPRSSRPRTTSQAVALPESSAHRRTITLQLDSSPTPTSASTPRFAPKVEQIHPGTRPFAAPEILRETCTDPILADAYSFGMVLYCIDLGGLVDVDRHKQIKGEMPDLSKCEVFAERIEGYLVDVHERKRITTDDFMGCDDKLVSHDI